MRTFWAMAALGAFLAAGTACRAEGAGEPANAAMKALFEEMKSFAQGEKGFREAKKIEVQSVESQIDQLRADAKTKGETKDPAAVKPLQEKRLALLEEVVQRDVTAAEKNLSFAQRRLDIAHQNLSEFEQKKAEAERKIAA